MSVAVISLVSAAYRRLAPSGALGPWAGALVLGTLALSADAAAAGPLQLLMFERDGCSYCRRWNEEIGPAYPKTPEGAAAPLRRLQITAPLPPDVALTGRPPAFTPTFVLTDGGTEVGRIEGYAGDQFFWVLLDDILGKTGWSPAAPPADPTAPATGEGGRTTP